MENFSSAKAQKPLEEFKDICNSSPSVKNITLEANDLLIIDNRKAFHGRSSFQSNFGKSSRWLQRVFIKSQNLWELRNKFYRPRILDF